MNGDHKSPRSKCVVGEDANDGANLNRYCGVCYDRYNFVLLSDRK